MRKVACALLLLGLAACGRQGGGDEASQASDSTPSMSAMPADTAAPCVGDTCPAGAMVRDTSVPCDTCSGRD
jgi:hypothetical protein